VGVIVVMGIVDVVVQILPPEVMVSTTPEEMTVGFVLYQVFLPPKPPCKKTRQSRLFGQSAGNWGGVLTAAHVAGIEGLQVPHTLWAAVFVAAEVGVT
jgi:hypothetical protein